MKALRKFRIISMSFALGLALAACSIFPTATPTPTPTSTATSTYTPTKAPTSTPTVQPSKTHSEGPLPELVGKWLDPDTGASHVIAWQNGKYVVTESKNPGRVGNEIVSSTWENGALIWQYFDAEGSLVTVQFYSVASETLYVDWFNDQGFTGSTVLQRMPQE